MEPTGSEKVLNKMNITINLLILTTAVLVLVQFCELLIYRSSSTVLKLGGDVTDDWRVTVWCCISLMTNWLFIDLKWSVGWSNIVCDSWHNSNSQQNQRCHFLYFTLFFPFPFGAYITHNATLTDTTLMCHTGGAPPSLTGGSWRILINEAN